MEKQFVPYELAVKLKEFGYPQTDYNNCFGRYRLRFDNMLNSYYLDFGAFNPNKEHDIFAPLWQQAFDWFREKYRYSSIIPFNGSEHYYWWITECNPFGLDINSIDTHDFTTYEEARQACLEKLIELITKKD